MAIASLTSKIDSVKVYAAGATITRVAHLQLNAGEMPEQVEIAGLPLALDDTSVRVRVEAEQGAAAIATDLRIGLSVPPRQEVHESPTEEEVREAQAEVRRLEDAIALIENEISILYQLDVPKRPEGEQGKAPPPSPITARLALANFKDEQVRARITEGRETQEKLRKATEHLEDLLAKKARASCAREVRPNELRKTVVVRLSYEGEASTVAGQRLVVEYFVPGARWTPSYICRLDSTSNQATIAVRALICQRTGEDWSGVRLELSTAEPMTWYELPELPSLRIGRAQPVVRKSGWRLPPIGAETLFENFDRQKEVALLAIHQQSIISEFPSPQVPPLPNLVMSTGKHRNEKTERHESEQSKQSLSDELKGVGLKYWTEKTLKAIQLAQEESLRLGHNFIGTEQILLGLLREDTGVAARVLKSTGVNLKNARIEVEKIIGRGSGFVPVENPPLTPRAKRVLELAIEEAHKLGNNYLGTEHVLLSLSRGGEDYAAKILENLGVDRTNLRKQVIGELGVMASVEPSSSYERTNISAPDEFDITLMSAGMLQEEVEEGGRSLAIPQPELMSISQRRRKSRRAVVKEASDRYYEQERFEENFLSDRLAYGFMRLGAADDLSKRGKLAIEQQQEAYLEILKRRKLVVTFDVIEVVQQAVYNAQDCNYVNLPPGGINVRQVAGSFDYAYSADGRIDVPSDGEFHSVALTSNITDVDLRYVVVPRTDTNVFRIIQLKNPLQAPLLAGPADVYVDGEYILSTNITTVPPKGQMELGVGVEQAIKVARNTTYQEVRSSESLVALNELRHQIKIDIANRLPQEARIEVRERISIPNENAKVDVQIDRVSPDWEKYEQEERGAPIRGGYRWQVRVPARGQMTLSAHYTIKTFVDSEIIGGNRRE